MDSSTLHTTGPHSPTSSVSSRIATDGPDGYDTTAVVELLKTKRKPRTTKSCFPCRYRKVRCDGRAPCSSCIRRDHASLCRTANPAAGARLSPQAQVPQKRASSPTSSLEERIGQFSDSLSHDTVTRSGKPSNITDVTNIVSRLDKIEERIASLKSDLLAQGTTSSNFTHTLLERLDQPYKPNLNEASTYSFSPLSAATSGNHFVEAATGATIFIGDYSDPPLALGCTRLDPTRPLDEISPGQDQLAPRTYAFANLWSPETTLIDIARALPDDSDIIRYWQIYQGYVHPFYPALVAYKHFGTLLFSFLDRRLAGGPDGGLPEGTSPSWLGLLFSVLACGVQFSTDPIKERDLRSKVFVCSSFQCLRLSNFFTSTDLEQIQTMALLGHCLRNNLDMNSSWILMGTTIRLAQSIGLHAEPASPMAPSHTFSDSFYRRRLWWMLIWQDTFLSLTYDRPPANTYPRATIPEDSINEDGQTFANSILRVCKITLDQASEDTASTPNEVNTIRNLLRHKQRFQTVIDNAQPFLVDKAMCKTLQDHLERLALHIHVGYVTCRIYRLCLESNDPAADQATRDSLATEYASNAIQVVQSFLDMFRLSSVVCRSWAFVHNVASSCIPLRHLPSVSPQVLDELSRQFRPLVQRLIAVLEDEAKQSEWYDADINVRQYGPYSRVVKALKQTYEDEI